MIRRSGVVFPAPQKPANDAAAYQQTGERSQLSPTGGLNDSITEKTDTKTDDGSSKNTASQEVDALMLPNVTRKPIISNSELVHEEFVSLSPIMKSTRQWSKVLQTPESQKPLKLSLPNTVSCNDDFESKLCGERLYQSHPKNPMESRSASVDEMSPVRFQSAFQSPFQSPACSPVCSPINCFNPTLCETFPAFSEPFRSGLTATPVDISQNKFSENEIDPIMYSLDPNMQCYLTVDNMNIAKDRSPLKNVDSNADMNRSFRELTPDRCAGTGIDGGSVDMNNSFLELTSEYDVL